MPISTITLVLLRLFALGWALRSIGQAASLLFLPGSQGAPSLFFYNFVPLALYLAFAIVTWILGPAISKFILRNHDTELSLSGVTREDLYATGFISVGTWFVLSSIGDAINWIRYTILHGADTAARYAGEQGTLYDLMNHVITLLAGITLIATAHIWARKLNGAEPF